MFNPQHPGGGSLRHTDTPMEKITNKKIVVTERSLQKAAARLLPKATKLVSTEVDYLRRTLGNTATQGEIDERIVAVRKMPWSQLIAE